MTPSSFLRHTARVVVVALAAMQLHPAQAQPGASKLSTLSALPIALSVTAGGELLSAGAALTVAVAEVSADGTVWVLERASDGARATVRLGTQAAVGLSVAVGTVVLVTALSTGWVLSQAGRAIAFVPNRIGGALLYNEQVTR